MAYTFSIRSSKYNLLIKNGVRVVIKFVCVFQIFEILKIVPYNYVGRWESATRLHVFESNEGFKLFFVKSGTKQTNERRYRANMNMKAT